MATAVTCRPELRQADKRSPQFHFALSVGPAFQYNSLQLMYDFFSSYTKVVLHTVRGVSRCIFLLTNDTYSLVIGGVQKFASRFGLHIKRNVRCRGRGNWSSNPYLHS